MAAATSSLQTIREMVRQLAHKPSENQLSDSFLDQNINTFIAYNMPANVRLFDLHTTFTFQVQPNIDTYSPNTTDPTSPLYNFNNIYLNFSGPAYVAGYNLMWSQSPEQTYGMYPYVNTIASIGVTGNGSTTTFTGTLSAKPILQNRVMFTSIGSNNIGLNLVDQPDIDLANATGFSAEFGTLVNPDVPGTATGTINYITGAYDIEFTDAQGAPSAPSMGATINSQTVPYVASRPQVIMFYDEQFIFRPVPDQVYAVNMLAYQRPTQLLLTSQSPQLEEWYEYIAYGAAIKILLKLLDFEIADKHTPKFKQLEAEVLRKTIVQNTTQRSSTIYVSGFGNTGFGFGYGGWNNF